MKLLKYKGYFGSIEASAEDECLYTKIEFINALVKKSIKNTVHS